MNKRYWALVGIFCLLFVSGIYIIGCGSNNSSGSSSDYGLSGKLKSLTASGMSAQDALTITHVIAVGSNGEKHLATLDSNGNFSITVTKGVPYAVGFYNKTGSTITLLGYLKQNDVNWDSLPLMNPTGSSMDLGTVEVNSASTEATTSVNLTSLISQMNMVDQTNASYYGSIDDAMIVFTNMDVDGNGEFDMNEGKYYMYQSYINMAGGTGQIAQMQSGNYNESYAPSPESYTTTITAKGDSQTVGASIKFTFPSAVGTSGGSLVTEVTSAVEATGGGEGWTAYSKISGNPIATPEVTPAGTHVVEVGGKTYTFRNYHGVDIVGVHSNNGYVFPVFNLVTNEAGYITTANFKWKKMVNGATRDATANEVKAIVEDTSLTPTSAPV
ncbi:MAG: hypothetical protein WCV91_07070, partial [Candidatus Margulisiibacteriota bacterium]